MQILFVSEGCCIRVIKEAIALMKRGHTIYFLQNRIANRDMSQLLTWSSFYNNGGQFIEKLRSFNGVDLVHVHNEPSRLATVIRETLPDTPMVFDAHDLNTVRTGEPDEEDVDALDAADGVIFPSSGYQEYCTKVIDFMANKPSEVIYSMCNIEIIKMLQEYPHIGGVVYEGRCSVQSELTDHRNIASAITAMGHPFHVFPSETIAGMDYVASGAIPSVQMPYLKLIRHLQRFDWGFVGGEVESKQREYGMPNKLFEYTAAGIPSIVLNAKEAGEFAEQHGIGVMLESITDLMDVYDKHKELKKNVMRKRLDLVMENQADKIESLYARVMGEK